MKKETFLFVLAVCGLMISSGCQGPRHPRAAAMFANRDRGAVMQASLEWDRLFNAGDARALASLYAENAISMPPNAPTLMGRFALQSDFEGFFAANFAQHQTIVEDLAIEGNIAIERARYRLMFRPRGGGPETIETGRHVEIRQRINGEWKIVIEIWNSDQPLAK